MSIRLIVEVLDHAPADLTPSERLVLVVLAEDANDVTREGWPGMDKISRRTGLQPDSVRRVLQRLAKRGLEIRVPIGKDKRGRLVFAHEGASTRYRIPILTTERRDEDPASEEPRGGTVVPKRRDADPSEAGPQSRPSPQSPQSPHLSVAEQVVRAAGVVAEHEERELINWINNKHKPNGPAWWRKVASNGDFPELAAAWRADQGATGPSLPPCCGPCLDDNPAAKHNPRFRQRDGAPCPACHPDHVRSAS